MITTPVGMHKHSMWKLRNSLHYLKLVFSDLVTKAIFNDKPKNVKAETQLCVDGCSCSLTVQNDSSQRLVVVVEDLPEGEGLLWSVVQQSEQQGDGVV